MAGWKLRKDKTQTDTPDKKNAAGPLVEDASPDTIGFEELRTEEIPAEKIPAGDPGPEAVSRWELPPDDWSLPASPVSAAPAEDEPMAAEDVQHDDFPLAHPIELGTSSGETFAAFAPVPPAEAAQDFGTQDFGTQDFGTQTEDGDETTFLPHFEDDEESHPGEADSLPPKADSLAETLAPLHSAAPLFSALPVPPPPSEAEEDQFTATLKLDRAALAASYLPPAPTGQNIPPVAPFLVDVPAGEAADVTRTLVVRMGRLSATFELTKDVTVIGRPDSILHYYPDVEIEMDDAVSRRHAEILKRGPDFYLVDAGSTNGTLLNGESLEPQEEHLLAHGDRIRVGERTEIIFE